MWWAPQVVCSTCNSNLHGWKTTGNRGLAVKVPAQWQPPSHPYGEATEASNCFFCRSIPAKGPTRPAVPFFSGNVIPPVLRIKGESFPVPPPPPSPPATSFDIHMESQGEESEDEHDDVIADPDWQPEEGPLPILGLVNQEVLDTIIMSLNLPQNKGELLGSILLNQGLLKPGTKIGQRDRSRRFDKFFEVRTISFMKKRKGERQPILVEKSLVVCIDIKGLLESFGIVYVADDWRLFLDGSANTFNVILLHNEHDESKRLPSIHIAIGNDIPETYETVKAILEHIGYENHRWKVQGDFKMLLILSGIKHAACKWPCYLCNWDSRDTSMHYLSGEWTKWTPDDRAPNKFSFGKVPLIPPEMLVLPELHIRLGIFQQFIKALYKQHSEVRANSAYEYYARKFSRLGYDKLKIGALTGPDILKLVEDVKFVEELEKEEPCAELEAWHSYVDVVKCFFGKDSRPEDYKERIGDLIATFQAMGCNMSLKLHFLADHLEEFPVFLSAFSEQHGERGHQVMRVPSERYPSTNSVRVMSEWCFQTQPRPALLRHAKVASTSSHF